MSDCAEGYQGYLCSTCSTGYYMADDLTCQHCPEEYIIVLLYLAQFALLIAFMIVLLVASDHVVSTVQFVLLNIRYAAAQAGRPAAMLTCFAGGIE